MDEHQSAVGGRALEFLASFARETKDSLSLEVCRMYIKQVLDESESLEMAACALQVAIIAKRPPRRIQQDRDWKRLVEKFPDREKISDEKRLIYNLTAIWTKEVLEHYGWHEQKKRFLQPLYQCAKAWPHFESQFTPAASCVLISRHEACILERGHKKLKTIGFHNQTRDLGFVRPLSIGDVELLAKWSKREEITAYGGERFPERPTEVMLKHVKEWTEDTDGSVVVDGTSLRVRGAYHPAYDVIFDRYGLVVHCDIKQAPRDPARKRPREEPTGPVEDATAKGDSDCTPLQKKTKKDADSVYPSPPRSSPQLSIVSSPLSSIDSEDELGIGTDEESSSSASTGSSGSTDTCPPAEVDSPGAAQMNVGKGRSAAQIEPLLQAYPRTSSTNQHHSARPSSAVPSYGEIPAHPTSLSRPHGDSSPCTMQERSSQQENYRRSSEQETLSRSGPDWSAHIEINSHVQPGSSASLRQKPVLDALPPSKPAISNQTSSTSSHTLLQLQQQQPQRTGFPLSQPALPLSSPQLDVLPQSVSSNREDFETSHFDAQYLSPNKTSTSSEADPAPHLALYQRHASNATYVLRPIDSATSSYSFSSLINASPDAPNHAVASPTSTFVQSQSTHLKSMLNNPTGCTPIRNDPSDVTASDTPVAPFDVETPNSPSLPIFRAITSANKTLSAMVSPSGSSLSVIDELVESLRQEIDAELIKNRAVNSDDDSNGDARFRGHNIEKAGMELCTTEESRSHLVKQDCPICKGICALCQVPIDLDRPTRHKLFEYGHHAQELERMAPNETLRRWTEKLTFARYLRNTTEGDGDVCLLSWESCRSQFEKGHGFQKPAIIREDFADSEEWTPSRYADLMEIVFQGTEVDVKWHQQPQPERVSVLNLVELLRSQPSTSLSKNPPNVLNLPDITDAISPSFLRMDRFRVLNLVMERCRADMQKHIGKQVHLSPFDIGSCRKFNILGWPGAFSGPHVDSNGATWIRNLFGYKLWMFVPKSEMGVEDWERFAKDGDKWDPRGKSRAVILEPGDVFVMEHGLVHSVQTLGDPGPCLMTGGMFLDQSDLLRSLETIFWIGKNQNATNEPIAYQLAQVISTLEDMVEQNPRRWFADSDTLMDFRRVIKLLRSLGCDCEDCDDKCRCSQEHRRCTPLCAAHHTDESTLSSCMLETGNEESDPNANDSESSDEEYTE